MAEGSGKELNTKATVAGGGAGTLLLVLASQISPDNDSLKAVLTYASPAVSVGAAAAWVFAAAWATSVRKRWVVDRALKRARAFRDGVCNDASASPAHKIQVRDKVEHFEKLAMAVLEAEFDSVDAKLEP